MRIRNHNTSKDGIKNQLTCLLARISRDASLSSFSESSLTSSLCASGSRSLFAASITYMTACTQEHQTRPEGDLMWQNPLFWRRIQSGQWIWIHVRNSDPDPEGQKWPTIRKKVKKFQLLDILLWGLKASLVACPLWRPRGTGKYYKLQLLIKKILNFFKSHESFSIFGHKKHGSWSGLVLN